MRCVTVAMALLLSGCLIPPPLEVESSDGGPNHPPKIIWDLLQPPSPLTMFRTDPGKKKESRLFNISLYDPDPQTVHLNVFLDGRKDRYAKPVRSDQVPATPSGNRSFILNWEGLCDELVNYATGSFDLEFYISDSGFMTEGEQNVPKPGGQAVPIFWRLVCVLPPPSLDGGT
jgi:hypothetical protein